MALNTNSENLRTILEAVNGLPDAISVDSALSATSTNPVQNKVVKEALDGKAESDHGHSYNDLTDKPTIPAAVTVDTAMSSSSTNPVQNKVVNTALSGKAPKSHASTATTYGVASASNYGHAKASGTTPKAIGTTAAVGSETSSFARGDHVHALPTSGVTAGSYGPTAAVTSGSFNVPQVTVDTYGRVTEVTNRSVTLPSGADSVAASKVTAGTLAGKVQANATAAATLGDAQVRDIIASTTDLTAGASQLAAGTVYLVYE